MASTTIHGVGRIFGKQTDPHPRKRERHLPCVSFISVATIGYGDLVPVPDTWGHTVAIIAFLSAGDTLFSCVLLMNHFLLKIYPTLGVVILSTLFDRFGCYLQYVHYIGRRFRGRKDVEIWFGGSVLTVQELITL
ncbi:hypothetical protein COOONC_13746, partial [Cooperia oncophora]